MVPLIMSLLNPLSSKKRGLDLNSVIENMPCGVMLIDSNGVIRELNDHGRLLLGLWDVKGVNIDKILSKKGISENLKKMIQGAMTFLDSEGVEFSDVYSLDDGKNTSLRVFMSRDQSGDKDVVIIIMIDETEFNKVERDLEESYKKLEFFNDILYHDIGNILQIVQTSSEILGIRIKDPSLQGYVENINQSVERARNILKNSRKLLELRHQQMLRLQKVDIRWIIEQAREELSNEHPDRELKVKIDKRSPKIVQGHPIMYDLFYNLMSNSIKYDPNYEVVIDIKASFIKKKKCLKLSISDHGPGIPDDRKEQIFNRYKRIITKDGVKGTGLGLAIASSIVDLFNGSIKVKDRINNDHSKGVRFVIFIPQ